MAWSTPITWVTGDMVTAGKLNTITNDGAKFLHGNGTDGRVNYRVAGTTPNLVQGVEGLASWGTVIWDATNYLADRVPELGLTYPIAGLPTPVESVNLIVARSSTRGGGATGTSTCRIYEPSFWIHDLGASGGTAVDGYTMAALAVDANMLGAPYETVLREVYAAHSSASTVSINLAADVTQMLGV